MSFMNSRRPFLDFFPFFFSLFDFVLFLRSFLLPPFSIGLFVLFFFLWDFIWKRTSHLRYIRRLFVRLTLTGNHRRRLLLRSLYVFIRRLVSIIAINFRFWLSFERTCLRAVDFASVMCYIVLVPWCAQPSLNPQLIYSSSLSYLTSILVSIVESLNELYEIPIDSRNSTRPNGIDCVRPENCCWLIQASFNRVINHLKLYLVYFILLLKSDIISAINHYNKKNGLHLTTGY